jgi:hypothetical protein
MIKKFLYLLMPVVVPHSERQRLHQMTSFQFTPGAQVWEEYGQEGLYNKVPASKIKFNCELPLTVCSADSIYAVKGNDWYIGGITNHESRTITINNNQNR